MFCALVEMQSVRGRISQNHRRVQKWRRTTRAGQVVLLKACRRFFTLWLKKAKVTNMRCHDQQYKWTRYSLVCCITHHHASKPLSPRSLSVYTSPSFSLLPHFSRSLIFRWQALWIFDHTAWKNSTESCCKASLSLTLIPSHHISISSEVKHI